MPFLVRSGGRYSIGLAGIDDWHGDPYSHSLDASHEHCAALKILLNLNFGIEARQCLFVD